MMDEIVAAYFTLPPKEVKDLPGLIAKLLLKKANGVMSNGKLVSLVEVVAVLAALRVAQIQISGLAFSNSTITESEIQHHRGQLAEADMDFLKQFPGGPWTKQGNNGSLSEDVKIVRRRSLASLTTADNGTEGRETWGTNFSTPEPIRSPGSRTPTAD